MVGKVVAVGTGAKALALVGARGGRLLLPLLLPWLPLLLLLTVPSNPCTPNSTLYSCGCALGTLILLLPFLLAAALTFASR